MLGIDYGAKRVGVAVSDGLWLGASPLAPIRGGDDAMIVREIAKLQERSEAIKVIVGLPIGLDGQDTKQTKRVRKFVKLLEDRLGTEVVVTWDERLTSTEADELMLEADMSRKARKGRRDGLAAAVLLRSYMNAHRERAASEHTEASAEVSE